MSLATYQEKLSRLVVNTSKGRASPHKICMLLALFDLARGGGLRTNRIYFSAPLLERYAGLFAAVRGPGDRANPYFPFFHLKGNLRGGDASFWHLIPKPGRETVLHAMQKATSAADIVNTVEHATLDPELFQLLQDPHAIDELSAALAEKWFDRGLSELRIITARLTEISTYERGIRTASHAVANEPPPAIYIRSPAFRRVIVEIYDYRCAATGLRFLTPNGEAMVEAAHIHPFKEAGDDDPRNGIALTPDMHWAMDRNLIAPGPDLKWHVSPLLDGRVPEHHKLVQYDNRPLIGPTDSRMTPKHESLVWRMNRLREPGWSPGSE